MSALFRTDMLSSQHRFTLAAHQRQSRSCAVINRLLFDYATWSNPSLAVPIGEKLHSLFSLEDHPVPRRRHHSHFAQARWWGMEWGHVHRGEAKTHFSKLELIHPRVAQRALSHQ